MFLSNKFIQLPINSDSCIKRVHDSSHVARSSRAACRPEGHPFILHCNIIEWNVFVCSITRLGIISDKHPSGWRSAAADERGAAVALHPTPCTCNIIVFHLYGPRPIPMSRPGPHPRECMRCALSQPRPRVAVVCLQAHYHRTRRASEGHQWGHAFDHILWKLRLKVRWRPIIQRQAAQSGTFSWDSNGD